MIYARRHLMVVDSAIHANPDALCRPLQHDLTNELVAGLDGLAEQCMSMATK